MRATTYLGENIVPHGKRARAVLGYLCLAAGRHVPRAELARLLWDRVPAATARTNLRRALRELSSTFGGLSKELITGGRDAIRFNVEACWIDALALVKSPYSDPTTRAELIQNSLNAVNDVLAKDAGDSGDKPFDAAYVTNFVVQD